MEIEIFRAISEAEKIDLETYNEFRPKEGAYEGKLFAESIKDAVLFGREFYIFDKEPIFIVKVIIDQSFVHNLGIDSPDKFLDVGATISVDGENLQLFNNNMTFNILDYLHYA
jgi:hypothetical protein